MPTPSTPAATLDLFRHALDAFDIEVAIFDLDCRYLYVNPCAVPDPDVRAWMVGRTDRDCGEFLGSDAAIGEHRMHALQTVIETGAGTSFEEVIGGTEGAQRHFVRRLEPVLDADGRLQAIVAYGHDVTELRRTQETLVTQESRRIDAQVALEQSEERFRYASRATNDVVWDWNLRTGTLFWSDALHTTFGHTLGDIGTSIDGWTLLLHPDDRDRVGTGIMAAIEGTARYWHDEYRFRRADGTFATVFDRGYILRDSRNEAFRMIGTMQDVTQQRMLEDQLRHSQKMEAVGKLAAGVAHDFNNILTAVTAYTELVLSELPADSPIRADMEEIGKAGARAKSLTSQLLAFSRRDVAQPTVLDLNSVVRDNAPMLQRTIGESIAMRMEVHGEPCCVLADAGQLAQVLMNFVINARDAMPDGGVVTIVTRPAPRAEVLRRLPAERDCVELIVRDTGVGMDPQTLEHLFEPFFTTKPVGKGSGLGLATVHGIVTRCGGTVWVESVPGQGSSFHVLLPRDTATPAPAAPAAVRPAGRRSGSILLVEDEESVRVSLTRMLESRGFAVVPAHDGADALLRASAMPTLDIVVSDVVMPGERGPEVVAALRKLHPHIGVVYMSGYTDAAVTPAELSTPRTAFIAKPFAFEELLALISRTALPAETGTVP